MIGTALSAAAALAAHRIRMLSTSGAIAATVVGTISIAAGWSWGALSPLDVHFGQLALKTRRTAKGRARGEIVEKGAERDWGQVLANGGVYAGAAFGSLMATSPRWFAIGAGALAASAADTWATEIGTLVAGRPISIISGRRVEPGTSGGHFPRWDSGGGCGRAVHWRSDHACQLACSVRCGGDRRCRRRDGRLSARRNSPGAALVRAMQNLH